jgi:hypothetical protein
MSSASPEIPVETGSYTDYKAWDVNMMAEPIMRIWQLSEALSRMSRRIQRRYPDESRILKTASEDVIYTFFKDMKERQEEFVKNSKNAEASSAKELDSAHKKKTLQHQQQGPTQVVVVGQGQVEEEEITERAPSSAVHVSRSRRSSNV